MKKIRLDKKYLKISLYSFAVLAACIILSKFIDNIGGFFSSIEGFLGAVKELLITFIYGFFIAFFFTPLVNFLDRFLSKRIKSLRQRPKLLRSTTIIITYAIFIGCIVWILVYMVPTLMDSVNTLIVTLPKSFNSIMSTLPDKLSYLNEETRQIVLDMIASVVEPAENILGNIPSFLKDNVDGGNVTDIITHTISVFKTGFNFIIGIIISFYMLAAKEELAAGAKKMCLATANDGLGELLIQDMQRVNMIFQSFVLGKLLDSIVLGLMCFVGTKLLGIPYALVISVIIGVTNMIPYVGPFIGTIPAVAIVLIINPTKALWLLIYVLVIQQIDNYIIGPKLLGEPTGLTPLEVLLSISVGAYFGGAFGMFIGVPVVASIKLFLSEAINRRFREKYPHGSPDFLDDDNDLWIDDDEDFVEDIPDD